jgi:hypothetical protein
MLPFYERRNPKRNRPKNDWSKENDKINSFTCSYACIACRYYWWIINSINYNNRHFSNRHPYFRATSCPPFLGFIISRTQNNSQHTAWLKVIVFPVPPHNRKQIYLMPLLEVVRVQWVSLYLYGTLLFATWSMKFTTVLSSVMQFVAVTHHYVYSSANVSSDSNRYPDDVFATFA